VRRRLVAICRRSMRRRRAHGRRELCTLSSAQPLVVIIIMADVRVYLLLSFSSCQTVLHFAHLLYCCIMANKSDLIGNSVKVKFSPL